MKKLLITSILVSCCNFIFAQFDTAFWFVAPEVASYASGYNFDKPVIFRIITQNLPGTVTISQPANSGFIPQNVFVPSNSAVSVDLTNYLNMIENKPANTVLNYGFYIHSTSPVQVYYEVASTNCNCNPETFVLKGNKALGTLFYTPFQSHISNSSTFYPTPVCAFDIVATENNTTVTITPKKNITGHTANTPFSITLNMGQTYSAAASSQGASDHLGGSKIESDKPIAVTIKDDLLSTLASLPNYDYSDLAGDQIVPVNNLGTQYIVSKGLLFSSLPERIYILATENNTLIYQNGNPSPLTSINEGQTYSLTLTANSTYIETSHPAYILHLSGNGQEVGTALVPPIECTGTNSVGIFRTTSELLAINLIVHSGGQGTFLVNGNSGIINSSLFSSVPGTNGQWVAAQINLPLSQVASNSFAYISNASSQFHLSMIQGGEHTGVRYAFFTNYNNIPPVVSLGNDASICSPSQLTLHAGNTGSAYLWNNQSTGESITVTNSGTYSVTVSNVCGSGIDSIHVDVLPSPAQVKTGNEQRCGPGTLMLGANNGIQYHWYDVQNGGTLLSSNQNFTTPYLAQTDSFWVANYDGYCESTRRLSVAFIHAVPPTPDIVQVNATTLEANVPAMDYEWKRDNIVIPENTQQITVTQNGLYAVRVRSSESCYSDFSQDYQFTLVSDEKIIFNNKLSVYPNPFIDKLCISKTHENETTFMKVYTITGSLVSEQLLLKPVTEIFLNGLNPGLYVFEFTSGTEKYYSRLLKTDNW